MECVPNFSEGRDGAIIDAIANAIASVGGVKLLAVDPGAKPNRTVYTFVGSPGDVSEAAVRGAHQAARLIDMSRHEGAHPRIGALDVCPIVPVSGVTLDDCAGIARSLGRRIAEELHIPVYFYERAATRDGRRSLANIRAGEYEGLERKLADPAWQPDCGPAVFNRKLGATVVGAREFLIAYNVNLNTHDKQLAHEIALAIRESGRAKAGAPGRLKAVRAIGWYIDRYQQAQVSVNLLDYKVTALHEVFEAVREEAARLGLLVTGSELVGMTPLSPILQAGRYYSEKQGRPPASRFDAAASERELVDLAIRSLGLDQLAPFDADKKIVEYAMRPQAPLLSLSVDRFIDEVASASPTPGGGSAAALAGSLAAALAAMVVNLTVGKHDDGDFRTGLFALAGRARRIKDQLARAVDDDARAYARVLEALRMPRGAPEEKHARDAAIQRAFKGAADVPLMTARLSLEALECAGTASLQGIKQAASDAAVAALLARAAVEGAVLNVLVNLQSIHDEEFTQVSREESEHLRAEALRRCDDIVNRVRSAQ